MSDSEKRDAYDASLKNKKSDNSSVPDSDEQSDAAFTDTAKAYSEQAYSEPDVNDSTDFDDVSQETDYSYSSTEKNNSFSSIYSSSGLFFNSSRSNFFEQQQLAVALCMISIMVDLINMQSGTLFMQFAPIAMFVTFDVEEENSYSSRYRF